MSGVSRTRRVSLRSSADLFHEPCDEDEKRVEDPNTHCGCLVAQRRARHVSVAYLNNYESDSESDRGPLAYCRHYIACQIKDDAQRKQRVLQRKLRLAIVPQTETNLGSVIVNREIVRMRDEIENPMREDCDADDQ